MSSVDEVWEAWKTLFFQAVERNIQKKLIKRRRHVPWLNSELKKLLHKKRRLWKKAKFSGDQAKWANYKKFSNLVKDNLNKAYFAYVKDLTASLNTNPKRFGHLWNRVQSNRAHPVVLYTTELAHLLQRIKQTSLINSFVRYLIKGLIISLPYQVMHVIFQPFCLYIPFMIWFVHLMRWLKYWSL